MLQILRIQMMQNRFVFQEGVKKDRKSIAGMLSGRFVGHPIVEVGDLVLSKKSLFPILTLVFNPSSLSLPNFTHNTLQFSLAGGNTKVS